MHTRTQKSRRGRTSCLASRVCCTRRAFSPLGAAEKNSLHPSCKHIHETPKGAVRSKQVAISAHPPTIPKHPPRGGPGPKPPSTTTLWQQARLPIPTRGFRLITQRQQQLRQTPFRRRVVAQHRAESRVAERFGQALAQGFARAGVVGESVGKDGVSGRGFVFGGCW